MDDIYARLTAIFRDVFDDDGVIATPELKASDVPRWDSLSHIRLILAIERAFNIRFKSAETVGLKNTGALGDLILRHLSRQPRQT
jgi:acyl carrier protein